VRALRNIAAISVAILAIASATALAVASSGGSARGDSGQGQYGTKPDCRPYASQRVWERGDYGRLCPQPGARRSARRSARR
jgi:hypothetical protein